MAKNMGKLSITFLIVCVTFLFSGIALADGTQIYKWVDSQGVVHYSDKAPTNPDLPVTSMTFPAPPANAAQAEAQNNAWIASTQQWFQSVVSLENEQQYNQILAWQESQDQAAVSSSDSSQSDSTQNVLYTSQIYGGYRGFDYKHWRHKPRPVHPIAPPVLKPSPWNTRPNPASSQLYNTNPNIHF